MQTERQCRKYNGNGDMDMKEFWQLYLIFARIGSITFGGGYAMLPILQRELVENRQWVTDEELMDYFAIGQCTPGIIALNVSTFIGNKRKGVLGGIIATLGFITIPIILIVIIALFLNNFSEYAIVKNAFAGIRVCVCVLILNAVERLWKKSIISKTTFLLFGVIFLLTIFTEIPLYLLVISSAVAGIVINALERSHA